MSETEPVTTAQHYLYRFYNRILRGKRYGPSVLDMIRAASSSEGLDKILEHEWADASAQTRRRWAKAAELRYRELEGEKRNHHICVKPIEKV